MTAAATQQRQTRMPQPHPALARPHASHRAIVIACDFNRKKRITDANGNATRVTVTPNDASAARVTLTQYDALNRPVRVAGPTFTDPTNGPIRPLTLYTYDKLTPKGSASHYFWNNHARVPWGIEPYLELSESE